MKIRPISIISGFLSNHPEVIEIQLDIYQRPKVERNFFAIKPEELTLEYKKLSKNLGCNEEIAFNSRVVTKNGIMHFPMIDFKTAWFNDDSAINTLLNDFDIGNSYLFSSGKSFHLYGMKLLTETEWISFMGNLLLLNGCNNPEFVDIRWIGHSLIAGSARLRFSDHSEYSVSKPKFMRKLTNELSTSKPA